MTTVSPVRAVSALLLGLANDAGHRPNRATVRIVTDDRPPQIVMYQGEPFLLASVSRELLIYMQHRPFRADASFEINA
jgi:hypothetical protein